MEKVFDYGDLKLDGSEVYSLLERMKTQETPATILEFPTSITNNILFPPHRWYLIRSISSLLRKGLR